MSTFSVHGPTSTRTSPAGACAAPKYAKHPDLWFPYPTDLLAITAAKKICATCPLARQCLAYALDAREPHGVWGGMSEDERRALLRRRGIRLAASNPPVPRVPRSEAKCGTEAGYQRHYADKTRRCQPCLDAHAEHDQAAEQQAVAS